MKRPTPRLLPRRLPEVDLFAAVVLAGLIFAASGCGEPEGIERYTVEKPSPSPTDARPTDARPTDAPPAPSSRPAESPGPEGAHAALPKNVRLLGAIVPRGSRCWFFKLTGPAEAVAPHADAFAEFVASIRFDESGADDTPIWSLPDGWEQLPAGGMRLATIRLGGSPTPLEMSVIPLGMPEMDEEAYVLSNVNRWRRQLGAEEIDASRLADSTEQVALDGTTATIVDVTGSGASERALPSPRPRPGGDADDD